MIWLQITANTGPVECCKAVAHALKVLAKEATQSGIVVEILDETEGPAPATLSSTLLCLSDGKEPGAAERFAALWTGTIQWIWQSSYRPAHKRKNWFISGSVVDTPKLIENGLIRFEATRASGPGGQHVNKTDSAVRATHIATGISVKVQSQRSQYANKRAAEKLIGVKLGEIQTRNQAGNKADRRIEHYLAERGNPIRVFYGDHFIEK